jgi:hypothetical protein
MIEIAINTAAYKAILTMLKAYWSCQLSASPQATTSLIWTRKR